MATQQPGNSEGWQATVVGNPAEQSQAHPAARILSEEEAGCEVVKVSPCTAAGILACILVVLFLFSNVLAVLWYLTGGEESGWQRRYVRQDTGAYIYWTSLHWALCQYSFGSMEIVPGTIAERVFGCLSPLLCIVFVHPLMVVVVLVTGKRLHLFPPDHVRLRGPLLRRAACLMFGVFALLNVFAVVWLRLGALQGSWMHEYYMREEPVLKQYLTALHWATSQLTFASMEVVPRTALERFYTLLVHFIGIMTVYPMVVGVVICMVRCLPSRLVAL